MLLLGVIPLAVSVALLVNDRLLNYDGDAGSPVYWLPLLTAAFVLPIAYLMRRRGS